MLLPYSYFLSFVSFFKKKKHTDSVTSPPEYRAHYSEALMLLPYSYHINSHKRRFPHILSRQRPAETKALEAARAAAGLPANSFLLCSYNQFFKVDPKVLAVWAAILKAVPRAKLVCIDRSTRYCMRMCTRMQVYYMCEAGVYR